MLIVTYADCHIKAPYAECRYAECRYAECHYAECRGANQRTGEDVISNYGEIKLRNFRPNGTVRFKKCKQLFEYQHLLFLRYIWRSKF
jgi:hypothetical protein